MSFCLVLVRYSFCLCQVLHIQDSPKTIAAAIYQSTVLSHQYCTHMYTVYASSANVFGIYLWAAVNQQVTVQMVHSTFCHFIPWSTIVCRYLYNLAKCPIFVNILSANIKFNAQFRIK